MKKNTGKTEIKKMNLNKKGFSMISEADAILFWVIVVFVISMCVILIVAWTGTLKKIYLNDALQPSAYEARLIYSDKCFAYKDPQTGRIYTGTIDPAKVNQDVLNACLPFDGLSDSAISILLLSANADTGNGLQIKLASPNWKLKTEQVKVNKYPVFIYGYGPGTLTFFHEGGE